MRISQNRREIRFHSWNATLMGVESLIAIQRQKTIGIGARPSPEHPFHSPHPPEIGVRSIPEDNPVQELGPKIEMIKELA
jgi:hypothetical protein